MRLGQLARKVSVHSSEILEFLGSKNVTIEEAGNNARISDEHAKLVFERFAPELLVASPVEVIEEISEPMPEVTAPVMEEIKLESIEPSGEEETDNTQEGQEIVEEAGEDELPDLIKAQKMELKGLTVLGKIELPGAKKKEIPAEELGVSESPESALPAPEPENAIEIPVRPVTPARQKRDFRENRKTSERPRKNPIALKREREEKEAEERRREEAIRQKEKRTQYYQSRVKPSVPTKAARIIDEPLYHSSETPVRDQPKTIWGKFLRWLTT